MQRQAQADGLDVVHPHVAHAHPGMPCQADDDGEGEDLHPLRAEDAGPSVVADGALGEHQLRQHDEGEDGHQGRGDALAEPVARAVVGTDDGALGTIVHGHGEILGNRGKGEGGALAGGSVQAEELGAEDHRQAEADHQRDLGRHAAEMLVHRVVAHVHPQVAQAGGEVVQVGPDQRQHHELDEPAGHEAQARGECRGELAERDLRGHRGVEHPQHERQQQQHDHTADSVQDRHPSRGRQAVRGQVREGVDVAEFRPLFGDLGHGGAFVDVTAL